MNVLHGNNAGEIECDMDQMSVVHCVRLLIIFANCLGIWTLCKGKFV